MSKVGRKPIDCANVKIELQGNKVVYSGKSASGDYVVPAPLKLSYEDGKIFIESDDVSRKAKCLWGLHRALLAARISGAQKPFERKVFIVGLGYKATVKGTQVEFNLGFSHPITYELPKNVAIEVDKTGQTITLRSSDKEALGQVCGQFRLLKPVEPYKGTGVRVDTDVIIRKAGKTKA